MSYLFDLASLVSTFSMSFALFLMGKVDWESLFPSKDSADSERCMLKLGKLAVGALFIAIAVGAFFGGLK